MSTRWYPLYAKGNPQLRVFLPNFWMKLVKPNRKTPENIVHFIVSMEMTRYDVRNYLEKIYQIPVINVRTNTFTGQFKRSARSYLIKDDDYRMAFVTLPKDCKFEFPELFFKDEKDKSVNESFEGLKKDFQKEKANNIDRPGVPTWFG